MQTLVLSIGSPINVSLQVGDAAYYSPVNTVGNSGFSTSNNSVVFLGTVTNINHDAFLIQVMYDNESGILLPSENDYIMFGKNKAVNSSDVKGYYASVKFKNTRTDKVELFSVGSEVSQSSK
tara:strand:- start:4042 stop:4407 length:366 start_codon:yes stop_codon:yes gene_type:complete